MITAWELSFHIQLLSASFSEHQQSGKGKQAVQNQDFELEYITVEPYLRTGGNAKSHKKRNSKTNLPGRIFN